ncbi:hypothetical protein BKI52_06190 [marine bacterium AO1-C]|nr:hypothetical protein BKI52_06190 [marine bacterium AO1-C]
MISSFDTLQPIYKGSNSIIYYQEKSNYGFPVVIKMFPAPVPTLKQLSYFKNEYEIVKDADIQGIRKALGQVKIEETDALVLEYVEGEAISTLLNKASIPIEDCLKIGISVSQTLGEIHQHQIIHRDINNNNILVNPNTLTTTIIDFGISSRIDVKMPHLGNLDTLEGTLAYISPEQTGRMNRVVDYRTDLYSLGVSLYEALTQQLPFTGDNSMELVHAHLAKQTVPPHEVNSKVPEVLSMIIMRLLAKNAEDRYQSAFGLKYDLEQCLQQWQTKGTIDSFTLGQQDFSGKFKIVEKLYGREDEIATILSVFDRITEGAKELLLVTGYSGIGKSALVNEIHKPITQKQGRFISGKYDQYQRDIPYSAINQAFNQFCAYLLTLQNEELQEWRTLIQETLGNNGRLLSEVIPNLELIIGEQPEVPEVGPQEAQNRFNLLMQNFVRVISTKEHPMILFLDDLQWADMASLNLLKLLMVDESNQYFLIIGAYRDNEVDASHPFALTREELIKQAVSITEIKLKNLSETSVNELVKDSLGSKNDEHVSQLSALIFEKTIGNAFFTTQLLKQIYEDGLLTFDHQNNQWNWQVAQIQQQQMADNVVRLMTQKIEKLSPQTQEILKLAACIGNQFDLHTLSVIQKQSKTWLLQHLWEAITAGLIQPLDEYYKVYQQKMVLETELEAKPFFKFMHDKIHQATYGLLTAHERQELNLNIGRHIYQNSPTKYVEEWICDIANYFNAGKLLIEDATEKGLLVQLNLQAGKKAKKSTAYQSAALFFEEAIVLLQDQNPWENLYEQTFDLYKQKGETAFLLGKFEESQQYLAQALEKARHKAHQAEIYTIQLAQLSLQGLYAQACELAVEALNHFGMPVQSLDQIEAYTEATQQEFAKYAAYMETHSIEDLEFLPEMQDEDVRIQSQIICWVLDSIILTHPQVLGFYTVRVVNMSIEHGVNEYISNAYVFNALIQSSQKNYDVAYRYASLAMRLNEQRFKVGGLRCKIHHINSFMRNLQEPLTNAHFLETFKIGLETGDNVYASFACAVAIRYSFPKNIQEAFNTLHIALPFLRKINNIPILAHAELVHGVLQCLQGKTKEITSFDSLEQADETSVTQKNFDLFGDGKSAMMWSFIPGYTLQVCVLFEQYEQGLPYVYERTKWVDESGTGGTDPQFRSEYFFYSGLILSHLYPAASQEKQVEYQNIINECIGELQLLASSAPYNFEHLLKGLQAEQARITGDIVQAMAWYDEAIKQAKQSEFLKDEALLSELAAKFWLEQQKEHFAELYIQRSFQLYKNWGAQAKADVLSKKYPRFVSKMFNQASSLVTTTVKHSSSDSMGDSSSSNTEMMDLDSILKASQTLSQEVKTEHLIEKMLHIVIENTGAEKGYLIENNQGELWVKVIGDANVAQVIDQPVLLSESTEVPTSLVNYVARSQKVLVLDDACKDEKFANDTYIQSVQPKSVLCYPVYRMSELSILFYLENNLTVGAFTPKRLEVLNTLSSQMAISIENALLYENLEYKVKERTSELNEALKEISQKNRQVMDSIRYAKRMQQAILISEKKLADTFQDFFVLYLPKDVVSGDFYWMNQTSTHIILAVVDCTGHGVPGAFMSMIGNALLNEIINEKHIYDPAEILALLHKGVGQALRQDETNNDDGMDVCLCCLEYHGDLVQVQFAGAKRPLYYTSQEQLGELPGDRKSIAGWRGDRDRLFTKHILRLQRGDTLYLGTDGYADMPNPRRRAFTHKRLKKLLIDIKHLPLKTQQQRLLKVLQEHQDTSKQRDDITLVGIRL